MQNKSCKIGLVVGIIILFICMGIQPAISHKTFVSMSDDTTPPTIYLYYEILSYGPCDWEFLFTAVCEDNESGMDRVEFSIDDVLMETDYSEPYEYKCLHSQLQGHKFFEATAYDKAGNSASEGFDFRSRIKDIEPAGSSGFAYLYGRIENNT